MLSTENTVDLLQKKFGDYGVEVIDKKLKRYGYDVEYLGSNTIIVLNSSDLDPDVLHKILSWKPDTSGLHDLSKKNCNYLGWEPNVARERNEKGDLQVRLIPINSLCQKTYVAAKSQFKHEEHKH